MIPSFKKTIAYVTGTRADFGLMTPILQAIENDPAFNLRVYAMGMHLLASYGNTVEEVQRLFSSTRVLSATIASSDRDGMAAYVSSCMHEVTQAFINERPDFVLLLGDRAEMLCVATACLYLGIPTGHIHAGDRSSTVDEIARHAITKLSSLQFPATEKAATRVLAMGEEPWRVHVIGAPAIDVIRHVSLPSREDVCKKYGLVPLQPYLLITQHPVSAEEAQAGEQIRETFEAALSFQIPLLVIYPNADPGASSIIEVIEQKKKNRLIHDFRSIPFVDFLALEREAAVWIGNSSAGLIESASFGTPVVNIGTRQQGRERGENVIDATYDRKVIRAAIEKSLHDEKYRANVKAATNPWGDGYAAQRLLEVLAEDIPLEKLLQKKMTY